MLSNCNIHVLYISYAIMVPKVLFVKPRTLMGRLDGAAQVESTGRTWHSKNAPATSPEAIGFKVLGWALVRPGDEIPSFTAVEGHG
jgi:hypothetical protein